MKVLVTGGGGFLGQYIVEQLLQDGHEVSVLGRSEYPQIEKLGVNCFRGDVSKKDDVFKACELQDAIIHTAAIAGIWGKWKNYYNINTQGTFHVLAACKEFGINQLVYTSSPSVTFAGEDQSNIDESAPYPTEWMAHYPHSKALAEQAVLSADGSNTKSGTLSTCALRPHLIWGPRDNHLIPRLINRAKSGRLRKIGEGKNLIDMTYVENGASAHIKALNCLEPGSNVSGKAYFISQDDPVNCWDWINEILELAEVPQVTKGISTNSAYRVGSVFEMTYKLFRIQSEPPMTRFLALQLSTDHYFNLSNAKNDFGYEATISNREGMKRLAEELKKS